MAKQKVELMVSGFLLIFSIVIYFVIIPREVTDTGFQTLSPSFFARISVTIIGVLSGVIFAKTLLKKSTEKFDITLKELKPVLIFMGGTLGYIYGIQYIGFYVSTMVALVGSMCYLGARNWKVIILLTAIIEGSIFLLFEKGLMVVMPHAFLF